MADLALAFNADEAETDEPKLTIQDILASDNLVEQLSPEELAEITRKAISGYKLDDASREAWKSRVDKAMDLAMLLTEEKNYPFKGAANVKYPLLTTAALQFNARAYPAIVQGDRIAKAKVNGHDKDGEKAARGDRVSEHMSWQNSTEMPEWEEDTDRLLMIVAITGAVFRKRYWDPTLGRQCSRLVTADRLVINYRARSMEDVPRISEEMYLYPYEIEERIRDGRFIAFEYGDAKPDEDDANSETDEDGPHKFIEQHRLIDLDGDDYPEPYIVTIHLETEKICRIVPNFTAKSVRVTAPNANGQGGGKVAAIRRQDYYTKYVFMQSPDGGAYGMGLGWLLLPINEAIDTTMNEMLDAGHLANIQGGFISAAAGLRERTVRLAKGEFKVLNTAVPINQAVMPIKFDGPSAVLFQLLGLLIEQGKDVANIKDVLVGDQKPNQTATATLALIEQGMKVFNAIFKRIHRAVMHELQLQARLNFEHLTPEAYNAFFDGPGQYDPQADYNMADMNVTPVSDPTVSTQMQALAKSSVEMEIGKGNPNVDQRVLTRRALKAAEVPDIDELMPEAPPIDPAQAALVEATQKMSLLELRATIEKLETEATKNDTTSLANIATAEAAEAGGQNSAYMTLLKYFQAGHSMEMDIANQAVQAAAGGPGGVPGMEGQPGNALGDGNAPPADAGGQPVPTGPALGGNSGTGQPVGGEPSLSSPSSGAM